MFFLYAQTCCHQQPARVFVALLISFAMAQPAIAAKADTDSADSTDSELETIIVTANRVPTPALDVGSAVSTIDRQLIDDRQAVFAMDLLQDLPGVAVSRTSGFGSQTQVRIRGAEANHVLVMIDGVKANDPAGNDEFDFASLTSYDIEKIELVRGPQSALWGSDATAGVINITTRQAEQPLEAGAFFEAGSNSTLYGGGRLALAGERAGVSLNASYFDTDGDSAAASGSEDDGYKNLTLGLNSRWQPSDISQIGFTARYTDGTTQFDGIDFATGLPADADLESDDKLLLLQTNGDLSTFDDRWQQNLKFTYLDSDRRQSRDSLEQSSVSAHKYGAYYQSTLQLGRAPAGSGQQLIAAIDYEKEKYQQRGNATFFGDPNQNQSMHNVGYVLEYLAQPIDRLNLAASVRYDNNSDFDNITTYRLTSAYRIPGSESRLHGSYGTGQKSPTFTERFGFFSDQFTGNPDLQPEKSRGFDIGIDQGFANSRLRVDVTYFNQQLKDEINGFAFDPLSGTFTAENLQGKSHSQGVEIEVDGKLGAGLTISASYTYTDATQPDPAGGNAREVRRPRHMAAININERLLDARANINLNISFTGEQTDQVFLPPTFAAQTVKLDSYVVVNLTGNFQLTDRISLYARAENLFDKRYSNVFGYQAPERGIYAGARVNFQR